MSKLIIQAGMTGTGKTTETLRVLSKVPNVKKLIFDPNGEYEHFKNEMDIIDIDRFFEIADNSRNTVILIEECTMFLSNRGYNKTIQRVLIQKRHKRNMIYMNYHSLRDVPRYIFNTCDYLTLRKTNDTEEVVRSKFKDKRIMKAFEEVDANPNRFYSKTIKLI